MPSPIDSPALECVPTDAPNPRRIVVSLSEGEITDLICALAIAAASAKACGDDPADFDALFDRFNAISSEA